MTTTKKTTKKVTADVKEETKEVKSLEFNETALSIVSDGNKKYSVVKITFDHKNAMPGLISIVDSNLDFHQAKEVFKTSVVKFGLFDAK